MSNDLNCIINREYSEEIDRKRKGMVLQSYYKYGPAKKNLKEQLAKFGVE